MDQEAADKKTPFTRIDLGAHGVALPKAFALTFEVAAFDIDDFDAHGIGRPPSIVRSVPKRQAEYLAGRRVAIAALRETGSDVMDLSIGPDRAPVWPTGFIGSLSHATGIAVAIAVRDSLVHGIGLDVERVGTVEQTDAIRSVALDADELHVLAPLADIRGWPYALTVAFSAKESFYKATAATVGRFFDFSALRIERCDPLACHLDTRIVAPLAPGLPASQTHPIRWVDLGPGTLLTSCIW